MKTATSICEIVFVPSFSLLVNSSGDEKSKKGRGKKIPDIQNVFFHSGREQCRGFSQWQWSSVYYQRAQQHL